MNVTAWLAWARGPLFWAALIFMVLGLLRHVILTLWEIVRVMHRAGDKTLPYKQVAKATLKWLFPLGQLGNRTGYGLTTLLFHVAVIVTPVFLLGHIALWKRGLGFSWPGLPNAWADALTLVAIATAAALVIERAAARGTRALSRFQDYAIPVLVALPFVTGFLVMHPAWNVFSYEPTLLAHVLSADLLLILIPITKLNHCALLPTTQLVSEVAWHFPPDAGSKLAVTLHKEGEAI